MVTIAKTGESREPSITFFLNQSSNEPSTTTTGGGASTKPKSLLSGD